MSVCACARAFFPFIVRRHCGGTPSTRDGAGPLACLELADGAQEGLLAAVEVPREAALQAVEALQEPRSARDWGRQEDGRRGR